MSPACLLQAALATCDMRPNDPQDLLRRLIIRPVSTSPRPSRSSRRGQKEWSERGQQSSGAMYPSNACRKTFLHTRVMVKIDTKQEVQASQAAAFLSSMPCSISLSLAKVFINERSLFVKNARAALRAHLAISQLNALEPQGLKAPRPRPKKIAQ